MITYFRVARFFNDLLCFEPSTPEFDWEIRDM